MTRSLFGVLIVTLAASGCAPRSSALERASAELDGLDHPGESEKSDRSRQTSGSPSAKGTGASQPGPTESAAPGALRAQTDGRTGEAPRAGAQVQSGPSPAAPGDSPHISRSPGQPHGMIVLWPRVVPAGDAADRELARRVQQHAALLVRRAMPGKHVDVRPEPERTCRRAGCDATAVGVLLSRQGSGCIVVAEITPPGPYESLLVSWAGRVDMRRTRVPFRTPPEGEITVQDFAPCGDLLTHMSARDGVVAEAVRTATPR